MSQALSDLEIILRPEGPPDRPVAVERDAQDGTARVPHSEAIERILHLVREHLDVDLSFVGEFADGQEIFRWLVGDPASFGIQKDMGVPLGETYCQRVVEGTLPGLIRDTGRDRRVRRLPATRRGRIGAYVGVPVRLEGGRLYGMLCALRHSPDRSLGVRDLKFMEFLARLIAREIEAEKTGEEERHAKIQRIQQLLRNPERLHVVFQRIVALRSGTIVGVEALARFPLEPRRGPAGWFADAWDVGLGLDLELLVARAALGVLDAVPSGAFLSVNVSPRTAMSPQFEGVIQGVPADRICLEVTEHAAVEDYDALNAALRPFRARGVRLAVDDAGAGFASFRHVLRLGPTYIKLDADLTRDIDNDLVRQALASSIIMFAARIGATIIAEGVETQTQLEALRLLGVSFAQGYHIGPPQPLQAMIDAGAFDVSERDERWRQPASSLPKRRRSTRKVSADHSPVTA